MSRSLNSGTMIDTMGKRRATVAGAGGARRSRNWARISVSHARNFNPIVATNVTMTQANSNAKTTIGAIHNPSAVAAISPKAIRPAVCSLRVRQL